MCVYVRGCVIRGCVIRGCIMIVMSAMKLITTTRRTSHLTVAADPCSKLLPQPLPLLLPLLMALLLAMILLAVLLLLFLPLPFPVLLLLLLLLLLPSAVAVADTICPSSLVTSFGSISTTHVPSPHTTANKPKKFKSSPWEGVVGWKGLNATCVLRGCVIRVCS